MTKWTIVLALASLPLIASPAVAQERPASAQNTSRTDVFIGFGGQRGTGDQVSDWQGTTRISIDLNVSDRVALVFIPSLGVGTAVGGGTWVDYGLLAGPRLRFRGEKRVTPFAQVLAGVGRGPVTSNGVIPAQPPEHTTAFLMSFAGGLDVALTPRFAWRAVQIEQRHQFGDVSGNDYVAASTGLVIRFGTRK